MIVRIIERESRTETEGKRTNPNVSLGRKWDQMGLWRDVREIVLRFLLATVIRTVNSTTDNKLPHTRYFITTGTRDVSGKIVKLIFTMKGPSHNCINLSLPCLPFNFFYCWETLSSFSSPNFQFQISKQINNVFFLINENV